MATFYSASTGGFLDSALFSELPDDAVQITEAMHQTLLLGQSELNAIVANNDGRPVLVAAPPPTLDRLIAIERVWRDNALSSVQWLRDRHRDELELGRDPKLSSVQFEGLLAHIQALRDWPQQEVFPDIAHRPVAPSWIVNPS